MKIRSFLGSITLLLLLSTINLSAAAHAPVYPNENNKTIKERISKMSIQEKEARAMEIKQRVQEIKAIDKSQLTSDQRKALRQELKEMKKEARQLSPTYIYISGAGLVLIIILLIILL
jgi:Flp pilus assembly protein TadB